MTLKLDMAKTYDRVKWSFLLAMMRKQRFGEAFWQQFKASIAIVTYSVLINGSPLGYIQQQRGLRQADLMSLLFLICVEGLSTLL